MIIVVTSWNLISGDTNCGKWLISCNFKFKEKDKILMNQTSVEMVKRLLLFLLYHDILNVSYFPCKGKLIFL